MKNLLVIGYVWPEPNSTAAGSRMLQLLECFAAEGYQISFASPALASEHAADLSQWHIETVTIELNNSSFDDFVQQLQPSVVLFDRFMMEEQFAWRVEKSCPDALRILDTEDLHCLRLARQKLAKQQPGKVIVDVPDELLLGEQAIREIAAILRCDLSLMISDVEMQLLKRCFTVPAHLLLYLPYMIVPEQRVHPGFDERRDFISIGNFRHEPNWDAVLTLKQTIWPLIRKKLPHATLHIYGAYPPKKATQLHNEKQGFLIQGWAEDAAEVLTQARVLLAPLRFGAGLKGKFIDAAQCGLPAVSTRIGVEGLFSDAQTVIATDDFNDFSEAAISLHENKKQWQALQSQSHDFLSQRFDATVFRPILMNRVTDLLENLDVHRLSNFTGRMLLHHSMKSSQYMSQWIEAKNRLLEKPSS